MGVLALDLGTLCGYAILEEDRITYGTHKLQNKTFGQRFCEFRRWLIKTIQQNEVKMVFFERVYRHVGTEAAHVYGALMYTMASVCEELAVPYQGLGVGAIKKFMTEKGNATKEEMIRAAQTRGFNPQDDNAADAIAILLLGLSSTTVFRNRHIKLHLKTTAKECLRVLPSLGRERVARPRLFASGRNLSEDDRIRQETAIG